MQQDLLIQAEKMFENDLQKWNSFLELVSQKDTIRNNWFKKLKQALDKQFFEIEKVEGWSYTPNSWGSYNHWYITEFGSDSLSVLNGRDNFLFGLHANGELFDLGKIEELLKTSKYSPILSCLDRIDVLFGGNWIAREQGNFYFESTHDGNFTEYDKLAWYAGNMTDSFVKQISDKVKKFRFTEITNLISEINKLSKK